MNIRTTVIGGISLLLLVSCSQRRSQQNESPEREYPVMVVEKQDAELQSVYPVTLRGKEDAEIKPRVSGYIDKVYIDEGAYVKKGQALNLNTARLDVDRIRPLADKNIVSTVQLETYENAYKASQASKSEAEVALKAAQATTGWTTVTSPIEGVVGSIPYRSGNMVTGATTLTTISNVETVYAYFSINEKAFSALLSTLEGNSMGEKIGNIPEATLTLADGTVYPEKGKVSTISGIVNQATGSVNLRVAFPNEQGVLRSGASGKVSIPRKVGNVFVIPQKSTFAQQDKIVLYKVVNDSTVQSIVQVDPLPDGKNYVVTQGLEEGDRIVLDGIATLRNAQKIKIKEER